MFSTSFFIKSTVDASSLLPDSILPSAWGARFIMARLAHILIAEDDHTIAHVVERVLEDTQLYQVTWVTDGDAALQSILNERPDLVLLDLMMPKRNGFEVCRAIREHPELHSLPICIMTALTDDRAHETAREAGANDILMKPFRANGLRNIVRQLIPAAMPEVDPIEGDESPKGEPPSWVTLVNAMRRVHGELSAESPSSPHLEEMNSLFKQAERRLVEDLSENLRLEELDLETLVSRWSKASFGFEPSGERGTLDAEAPSLFAFEADLVVFEAFLASLRNDIYINEPSRVDIALRRNGQTLTLECEVDTASPEEPRLSWLSVSLSQLLGASLTVQEGANQQSSVYTFYTRASSTLPSRSVDISDESSRLQQLWSGLLVSVHVVLCAEDASVETSLTALGPGGGILSTQSGDLQRLGDADGLEVVVVFPEFGHCKANAILHRRNPEWALLWRALSDEARGVLEEIRKSAPGGGFLSSDA